MDINLRFHAFEPTFKNKMDEKIESNSNDTEADTGVVIEIDDDSTLQVVIPKLKVPKKKTSEQS